MFCVKLWDVEPAAPTFGRCCADGGVVIPFQNGVDAPDMLRASLGARSRARRRRLHRARRSRRRASSRTREHDGAAARRRVCGSGEATARTLSPTRATGAGIDAELVADIRRALWEKFVFLAALSGATALARQPIGVVRSDPDLRAMFEAAMREAWRVGRARGVALADDFVAQQLAFLDALPAR